MEMITDVGGTMNSYVISICPLRTLLNMEQKSPKKAKINLLPNFRFIRAYVYFELVRRMGGVPLITQTLEYDLMVDPSYLRTPRAKEHEITILFTRNAKKSKIN